jgi:hypothetical protein
MFAPVERLRRSPGRASGYGVAALLATLGVAGCGGQRQDVHEPSASFKVDLLQAQFPLKQRLAQPAALSITVRNADTRTIPDIAITIGSPDHPKFQPGTSVPVSDTLAQAFGTDITDPNVASASRPIWILDSNPGADVNQEFNPPAENTGPPGVPPRGGTPAYTNTWALGPLAPGATQTFVWKVTAVRPGVHTVNFVVAAGLNGKAHAVLGSSSASDACAQRPAFADANAPVGCFTVAISNTPAPGKLGANGKPLPFAP